MADEVLLMGVVIGLYFYDSVLLLYRNEGILIPRAKRSWLIHFGSSNFRILGKDFFFPNPLLPHRALFRLSWQLGGNLSGVEEDWAKYRKCLLPLVGMVWCMALAIFLFLPLGLFSRLSNSMLVLAIVVLYVNVILALVWVWMHREILKLSKKRFVALSFELLVCSPFALNIIRTVSAGVPIGEDLINAARRLLTPDEWEVTRIALIARLDEAMEMEEEGSERLSALLAHRRRLEDECLVCLQPKSL